MLVAQVHLRYVRTSSECLLVVTITIDGWGHVVIQQPFSTKATGPVFESSGGHREMNTQQQQAQETAPRKAPSLGKFHTPKSASDHMPPPRKWRMYADSLLCATGPYVHRWIAETPWFSLRLHHWVGNDDPRAHHDHPWAFWTLILWGGYYDITGGLTPAPHDGPNPLGDQELTQWVRQGKVYYRQATHLHTVRLRDGEDCWTLVLTGPIVRRFGFFDGKRWWRANSWFAKRGKFACED